MTRNPSPRVGPLEELKRRRVVRVAIAYAAVAFAALEAVQLVLGRLAAPEIAWRVALGIAVLGFPIAIVLSFEFDVTDAGIVRTPEDATDDPTYDAGPWKAWAALVILAIAAGVLLRSIGG